MHIANENCRPAFLIVVAYSVEIVIVIDRAYIRLEQILFGMSVKLMPLIKQISV